MTTVVKSRHMLACLGGAPAFAEPVFIGRPRLPEAGAFAEQVASVFRCRWLTNDGALVRQLEKRLRLRLGVGFCAAFCNGTTALQVALRSLDLSGEVITTPFTFPATVHAIEWIGLTPVFCDVDRDTYNLDPAHAAALLSSRTSALVPVHVFGNPCDVVAIQQLAAAKGLKVVYDAAHAFGVSCHGRPIGCWGDLSAFSFHATKLFHTAEGGAVVGPDAKFLRRVALLRNFGIANEEEVSGVGTNGKLSELHAALGLAVLDLVDGEIATRARLSAHYRERLGQIEGLRFQRLTPGAVANHAYFTIEVDPTAFGLTRDQLHAALRAENIVTRKYFFPLCSDNEHYRAVPSADRGRLGNAHEIAARILCLPCHGDLTGADVDRIADCILAIRAAAPRIRQVHRL